MQILPLNKTILVSVKLVGLSNIPALGNSNLENVTTVLSILKYANPELLYFGAASNYLQPNSILDDELLIQLHILDAKIPTKTLDSTSVIKWCAKELKRNNERIVIKDIGSVASFTSTKISIYIRQKARQQSSVNDLVYQLPKQLDYAI